MRKYFFIIAVAAVAVMTAGCSGRVSDQEDDFVGGWRIVRSPISHTCYEAYDFGFGRSRVFSLGKEVKCPPSDQLK